MCSRDRDHRGTFVLILLILALASPLAIAQKGGKTNKGNGNGDDDTEAVEKADPVDALATEFEEGGYDAVLESVKKLKGTKLTAEQRARVAQIEGEALLRLGKFADAEKTLRTSVGDS